MEVAGSDAAVIFEASSYDYDISMRRDLGISPQYRATGVGILLLSRRISHFFNLKGPSDTVDTACSASMTALHLACQCLRNGDSKFAIVSGANLMLGPEIMATLSTFKYVRMSSDLKVVC